MAQIIKHRRGSIGALKDVTANVGELVMATGSIGDLNAPVLFIGESAIAGGYKPVSKIYQGATAPILGASYGSTMDGTPFYSNNNKTLYILDRNGNIDMDLTGNIEGNIISGVTINNLTGTTATFDTINLNTISFTGLTEGRVTLVGPNGSLVDSGSLTMNNGQLGISGSIKLNDSAYIYNDSALFIEDSTNGVELLSNGNYLEIQSGGFGLWHQDGELDIEANNGPLWLWSNLNDVWIGSYDGNTLNLNADGGEGNINIGNGSNQIQGYNTIVNFQATDYAQLNSNGSYAFVNSLGAHIQNNQTGSAGFTTRPNGIAEVTGSLHVDSDTTITGSLTISGNEVVDYIHGKTQEWNYLAFNGGAIGAPDVELSSIGQISLWSEGGRINVTGSINISGDTSVTGSLVVTDGAAFIDQGVVAQNSNVLLTSGSSLYINDGGSAYISGDLWVTGNTYTTGSIYTQGDIVLSGSINIGDNISTDVINFNGEVSSSIIPKINDVFDLGSSTNYWHNLYVSGTANVGILNANSISLSGITVFNDLLVSGSSYLGSGQSGSVYITGSVYNNKLVETQVLFAGGYGEITGSSYFTFDTGSGYLTAPIINANSDAGIGQNFLIGNDMWLGDVNETNATRFMGADDNTIAKIYLGSNSTNDYLESQGNVTLSADSNLYLQSQNSNVRIDSYDGSIRLNRSSHNNVLIGGNTYIDTNYHLYTNKIEDNSDNVNYLELYGNGYNNSNWWETGNGRDTLLTNNDNGSNLNLIQHNNGNVNIDAIGGSVNLHSQNGFNVTGSMIVSDGSGVFNSSLIVNNSDLTLDGGSNIHMNDSAHLYFDTCGDIYYDGNEGNMVFYNNCNAFQFRNDVSITGSLRTNSAIYGENGVYTDNVWGYTNNTNALHLNGGNSGASNVELASAGQISLFSEGAGSSYAINMTGSVHMQNNLDVSGSIYGGGMYNYNSDINGGGIYIDSGNYSEISYNDEQVFLYVSDGGIYGQSDAGSNQLISNAGDTTISANNGHHVYINGAGGINLGSDTSVSGAFTVSSGSMTSLGGDLYVSGNLQVLGSSTNVSLESHTVNIGDNIILVNAYSPFQRYAGLAAYDSGSSGVSGSLLWDSLNDYWLFVSSSNETSKLVGTTAGTYGSEASLTSGTFPIADGSNNIGDSLLTYSGTTLALNTNKFTVDSSSGDTYIGGNVTINGSGGSDLGSGTSFVTFRNDDGVLGFVDSTDTGVETTQVLGYETSTGNLVFSSLIDGGTY